MFFILLGSLTSCAVQTQQTAAPPTNPIPRSIWINDSINTPQEGKDFFNKAIKALQEENHSDAIINFTNAIEINPKLASAYYLRGLIKMTQKQFKSASVDLNKAGELGILEAYKYLRKIDNYNFLRQVLIHY